MISACDATCEEHPHVTLVHFCAACRGSKTSEKKQASAKSNGAKGGRPRAPKPATPEGITVALLHETLTRPRPRTKRRRA